MAGSKSTSRPRTFNVVYCMCLNACVISVFKTPSVQMQHPLSLLMECSGLPWNMPFKHSKGEMCFTTQKFKENEMWEWQQRGRNSLWINRKFGLFLTQIMWTSIFFLCVLKYNKTISRSNFNNDLGFLVCANFFFFYNFIILSF